MPDREEQLLQAFGHPAPPGAITQRQFDDHEPALHRIAAPDAAPSDSDLILYCYDLRFVPLQADLFRWAFLILLGRWRQRLLEGDRGSFTENFYYAVTTPRYGSGRWLLEEMCPPRVQQSVYDYLRGTLLDRIDAEQTLSCVGMSAPTYSWFEGLTFLGCFVPEFGSFWSSWWSIKTTGRAVAAVQYASCLLFDASDNPVFAPWTSHGGGGPPCLWSLGGMGTAEHWLASNIDELRAVLTPQSLVDVAGAPARSPRARGGQPSLGACPALPGPSRQANRSVAAIPGRAVPHFV